MADRDKEQSRETDSHDFQVVDKRKFVNLETIDTDTIPEETPRYPSYVEELMGRVAETERRFREKKKQIDEEIHRTKERLQTDFERKIELEKQKIILPFLEILDNLQRALGSIPESESSDHLLEGVRMTVSLFLNKLQAVGVERIRALGQQFDPNLAEAVGTAKVNEADQDGIVLEELQAGYLMDGRLLRPAQVRVGRLV